MHSTCKRVPPGICNAQLKQSCKIMHARHPRMENVQFLARFLQILFFPCKAILHLQDPCKLDSDFACARKVAVKYPFCCMGPCKVCSSCTTVLAGHSSTGRKFCVDFTRNVIFQKLIKKMSNSQTHFVVQGGIGISCDFQEVSGNLQGILVYQI